jgi:hypothetical protein
MMPRNGLGSKIPAEDHMHFKLSYITNDFRFGDAEIGASDPDKHIEVVLKARPDDG